MLRFWKCLPNNLVLRYNYTKDGEGPKSIIARTTRPEGGTRTWGTQLEGTTVVTHKGEAYIQVVLLSENGEPKDGPRTHKLSQVSGLQILESDNRDLPDTPEEAINRDFCCVIQNNSDTQDVDSVVGPISEAEAGTFGERYAEELGANHTVSICKLIELTEFSKVPA
jgi:hypothetical protein